MLTIHDNDIDRAAATEADASAYVAKHTMRKELIPTLNALLANTREQ